MEPDGDDGVQEPMRRLNWTTIGLIAGLVLLVLVIAYFATRGNSDQDKLTNVSVAEGTAANPEKLCAGKATYDLIKRELFRRAAQLRGSDQAAFDRLSGYAVLRMDNPVMENEDSSTGAVHCSGSLSLDLPPGVAVVGGRRTLTSDIDYTMQPAADGSGTEVLLQNADAVIAPLATLAKLGEPTAPPEADNEVGLDLRRRKIQSLRRRSRLRQHRCRRLSPPRRHQRPSAPGQVSIAPMRALAVRWRSAVMPASRRSTDKWPANSAEPWRCPSRTAGDPGADARSLPRISRPLSE